MYELSEQDSKNSLGHDPASLRARCRKVISPGFFPDQIWISSTQYWIFAIYLPLFIFLKESNVC